MKHPAAAGYEEMKRSVPIPCAELHGAKHRFLRAAHFMCRKAHFISKKKSTPFGVLFFLEVPARFELANESFADSCLTTWPRYRFYKNRNAVRSYFTLLERVTRLELATSTLARWRSTG